MLMLNTISGLPMHPLLVHLAVVAVPVAAVLAIIFAASRRLRAQVATVSFSLSIVAVVSTVLALALTGFVSAKLSETHSGRAAIRLVIGGALGLAVSYGVGVIFGATVA